MSGGFKWIELGIHHVIHDEDGRILAHIILDAPNARKCPIVAYVSGKPIGEYISAQLARDAVEDVMSQKRRSG